MNKPETITQPNVTKHKCRPDYDTKCEVCGQTPTVVIEDKEGKELHSTQMCGVCTFGTVEALDTDTW